MKKVDDVWFIRFPDGSVHRATSTNKVRRQVGNGRIPPASMVRRSPEEEWVTLAWTREFADLVAAAATADRQAATPTLSGETATVGSRLDPARLRTPGVPGAIQELLTALDSSLVRNKVVVALATGL